MKVYNRQRRLYEMIKEPFQQENVSMVNIDAPNAGAPSFIKQILMDSRNI